jgi:hypothetical protein
MIPHPDDEQDYFPECFTLTCPETAEIQDFIGYNLPIQDFFDKSKPHYDAWFWTTFAEPIEGVKRVQHFHPQERPDRKLSLLERLPTELIEEIIDVLLGDFDEDVTGWGRESVLCLAVSSAILYPRILSRIHHDYSRTPAPSWIGKRVGYHGNRSPFPAHQIQAYSQSSFSFLPDPIPEWQLPTG